MLEIDQRNRCFGDEEIIPQCIEMVRIIQNHPDLRGEFVNAFKEMWHSADYGWEPIMFCMRVLCWKEIQEYFRDIHSQSIASNDFRAEPCVRGILEAYEEFWDSADEEPYSALEAYRNQTVNKMCEATGDNVSS